jgi:hypothetical protein
MRSFLTGSCGRAASSVWVAALVAGAGAAQTTFFDWIGTTPSAYVGSFHCCPGDLNADGVPDVVSTRSAGGIFIDCIDVRSGLDGTLLYCLPSSYGVSNLHAAGDVDGDGVGDYAYNVASGGPFVWQLAMRSGATNAVLWSYTSGWSGPPPAGPVDIYRPDLAGAGLDYDGDGVGDLVTAAQGNSGLRVRIRSGVDGTQIAEYVPAVNEYYFVFPTPDVTGDGVPDVVVTRPAVGFVVVLAGPSLALFATIPKPYPTALQFGLRAGAAGDSNGDGRPDLAISLIGDVSAGAASGDFTTRIYTGPPWTYAYSIPGNAVASGGKVFPVEDLDGDGKFDFAQYGFSGANGFSGFRISAASNGAALFSVVDPSPDGLLARSGDFDFDGVRELQYSEPFDGTGAASGGRLRVFSLSAAAASVVDLGGSCGTGALGGGLLVASLPILGQAAMFTLTGAASNTAGDCAFDVGAPTAIPFASGCVFHLDPSLFAQWVFLPFITNGIGSASFALPLPAWPLASGFSVVGQAVLYPTASAPGFDVSNGLQLLLGY